MIVPDLEPDRPASEAARRAIVAGAESRGWREVDAAWIEDLALSQADLRRAGIEGAIDRLRHRRARSVVVTKLSRMASSLRDLAQLMDTVTRHQWALVALDADVPTAHGRVAIATFAPYERRFLAERTRAALAARKAAGLHVGRQRGVPNEIVQRIVSERHSGASLHAIANNLNADGIRGSARGQWHASTVRHVLQSVERDTRPLTG